MQNIETSKAEQKLSIGNITKLYENGDGVKNINFDIKEGELVSLLGPSGCGKTTILRAIGGFNGIDSGEIILDGKDISTLPPEKRPTSMVFQGYNLWPHMTIYENLAFGLKLRKTPKKEIKKKIVETLEILEIGDHIDKFPDQLSGGQQQRVAIARSLVLNPSVLLMDEPFSALDAKIRKHMRDEIKRIQRELGITIVFVTHDQEEAMSISDRIIIMNKGKIEQIGSPSDIYNDPRSLFTAKFIGEMNFIDKKCGQVTAFRPEDVTIVKEEDGNGEVVEARVLNKMILGHFTSLLVETNYGDLKLFLPKEEAEDILINEKINFKILKTIKY